MSATGQTGDGMAGGQAITGMEAKVARVAAAAGVTPADVWRLLDDHHSMGGGGVHSTLLQLLRGDVTVADLTEIVGADPRTRAARLRLAMFYDLYDRAAGVDHAVATLPAPPAELVDAGAPPMGDMGAPGWYDGAEGIAWRDAERQRELAKAHASWLSALRTHIHLMASAAKLPPGHPLARSLT